MTRVNYIKKYFLYAYLSEVRQAFFRLLILFTYLFLAAVDLCFCTQAFSSCGEWGLATLACGAQASCWGGFLLLSTGSRVNQALLAVARGL